ncbi:hypothetical protein P256_00529 [Acinetobacter nectaris CIP 110549]|uniref:Uncharacterized protein n=1 Tax=Acinetobacter nectaris CIP 110549 TaxID=1392540 RepID=V2TV85_9GAMM|nr:hypothetical protein [Acinetobacter nectaris]ESK40090.1 hypothetical protein P256_00529 [Acinetobacter nectaris CIP 110549]
MVELINKGKFRERANRSRSYQKSENNIAQLEKNRQYIQNDEKLNQTQDTLNEVKESPTR